MLSCLFDRRDPLSSAGLLPFFWSSRQTASMKKSQMSMWDLSIPTDPPYCLVYPTSYVRDADLDHFDTHNNLVGMCLHRCMCHATLQFNNDEPKERTNYARSCLILPRGAQYNDRLFPAILKPQNHHGLLIDSTMKEPYPMEMVGDFCTADPIFKGCYGDSLLYSDADLHRLRRWGIHLPVFQGEIPMPPAPSY